MSSSRGRLQAVGITRCYGGLRAVDDVTLTVEPGVVSALIGPNGAGKTTLFGCLTGLLRPDQGQVLLAGRDITHLAADARARLGIGRTFQRLAVFSTLSVRDNLLVGAEHRHDGSVFRRVASLVAGLGGADATDPAANRDRVDDVLRLLDLTEVQSTPAGVLPTGMLRVVELGRALCHDPVVLLLDEPASGLDTAQTHELQRILRQLVDTGVGVLLVEHDVGLVFDVADQVYAMAEGRLIASGTPGEVRRSEAVVTAYLDSAGSR